MKKGLFRRSLFPYYALPMAGVVTALLLFYLKGKYQENTDKSLNSIFEGFPAESLGESGVCPDVERIGLWAQNLERNIPEIGRLVVTWHRDDGNKFVLYPTGGVGPQPTFDLPPRLLSYRGETRGEIGLVLNKLRYNLPEYITWGIVVLLLCVIPLVVAHAAGQKRLLLGVEALLDEKTQELVHLEKLGLVGMLTANIFHDIKKPILNIRAEIDSLPESDVKLAVEEQVDLFFRMIRELNLEGFLRESGNREEYHDIEQIVDSSLRLIRYEMDNVTIEKKGLDKLPPILCVRHRLVQVFSNLFLNACQAMKGNGNLSIAGEVLPGNPRRVAVTVSDTGKGIPAEHLGRIFEPFFSTGGTESTGLGLYISLSIIQDMGGILKAESEFGKGASLTVTLPAVQE